MDRTLGLACAYISQVLEKDPQNAAALHIMKALQGE